jgi:arsenate reductase-like glutaredoxin family protein
MMRELPWKERKVNIQIFGTKKCNETKKAQRFFKERKIKFQFIDMNVKELSKGELRSVSQALGGLELLLDEKTKDQEALYLIKYITNEQKEEKVLENQQVLKTPIVRDGNRSTVGYEPGIWKSWL